MREYHQGLYIFSSFFRMEKLNVKIKSDLKELEEVDDMQDIILEIIYEYISEKQTEILFKIHWKMQIVNVKHFIDHYVRLLPDFKKLQLSSIKHHFSNKNHDSHGGVGIGQMPRKLRSLQEWLNEEIEDCIDSVAKLSPLVPSYIDYNSAEVGSASLMIAIKHSIKTIHQEAQWDKEDLNTIKSMYSRWAFGLFKEYQISKDRLSEFWESLEDFLNKVWE